MTPYYQDEYVTIYHGDCLDVLPHIGDVDHVITDPPYEMDFHQKRRRVNKIQEGVTLDKINFDFISQETRNFVVKIFASICKGWVLVFAQLEGVHKWIERFQTEGIIYKRTCIWSKPDGVPNYKGNGPGQGYETFLCGWAGSGIEPRAVGVAQDRN